MQGENFQSLIVECGKARSMLLRDRTGSDVVS